MEMPKTIQASAPLQKIFGSAVLALDTMIYGLLLILFIIGLGVFYIDAGNYNPFMPSGFGPVLTGAPVLVGRSGETSALMASPLFDA